MSTRLTHKEQIMATVDGLVFNVVDTDGNALSGYSIAVDKEIETPTASFETGSITWYGWTFTPPTNYRFKAATWTSIYQDSSGTQTRSLYWDLDTLEPNLANYPCGEGSIYYTDSPSQLAYRYSYQDLTFTCEAVTPATVTVSFLGNGGSPSSQSQTYTVGSAYGSFPSVTRSGYTFAGWNTSSDGTGTAVTAASIATSSITTLFAQWTSNTVTVTFHGNGGTPATQTSSYTIGAAYGSFPSVSRNGYTFSSWNTQEDGTGTTVIASTIASAGVTALYAQWTGNPIFVTFYDSYGYEIEIRQYTVGQTYASPGFPSPTIPTGSMFKGWYTSRSSSGRLVTESMTVDPDVTALYEKWVTVNIVVDPPEAATMTVEVDTRASDTFAITITRTLGADGFYNHGFCGWKVNSTYNQNLYGTTTFNKYSTSTGASFYDPSTEITVTAKFIAFDFPFPTIEINQAGVGVVEITRSKYYWTSDTSDRWEVGDTRYRQDYAATVTDSKYVFSHWERTITREYYQWGVYQSTEVLKDKVTTATFRPSAWSSVSLTGGDSNPPTQILGRSSKLVAVFAPKNGLLFGPRKGNLLLFAGSPTTATISVPFTLAQGSATVDGCTAQLNGSITQSLYDEYHNGTWTVYGLKAIPAANCVFDHWQIDFRFSGQKANGMTFTEDLSASPSTDWEYQANLSLQEFAPDTSGKWPSCPMTEELFCYSSSAHTTLLDMQQYVDKKNGGIYYLFNGNWVAIVRIEVVQITGIFKKTLPASNSLLYRAWSGT